MTTVFMTVYYFCIIIFQILNTILAFSCSWLEVRSLSFMFFRFFLLYNYLGCRLDSYIISGKLWAATFFYHGAVLLVSLNSQLNILWMIFSRFAHISGYSITCNTLIMNQFSSTLSWIAIFDFVARWNRNVERDD